MLDGWEGLQGLELAELKSELEVDGLQHKEAARTLLLNVLDMPAGAVVAVHGPWGRGKTNMLKWLTVQALEARGAEQTPTRFVEVVVLNPWQYGDPDLLSPLILQLLEILRNALAEKRARASLESHILERVKYYLPKILSAAANIALKAGIKVADRFFLWGDFFSLASDEVQRLLKWLFPDAPDQDLRAPVVAPSDKVIIPQQDPVSGLGESFRHLINLILEAKGYSKEGADRVLVCVDDLDRCLPHRQVALLEAIGFLTCRKAHVNFVISLDPLLTSQALRVHYGTDAFDVDRYLDKLFDLRVSLPALSNTDAKDLVRAYLCRQVGGAKVGDLIAKVFGDLKAAAAADDGLSPVEQGFVRALLMPTLRNPRVIRRVFERLQLLARRLQGRGSVPAEELGLLVLWLCMCECWPDLRRLLQQSGDQFHESLYMLWEWCRQGGKCDPDVSRGDPALQRFPVAQPEFRHVIYHLTEFAAQGNDEGRIRSVADRLRTLDGQLLKAGL
jgi:hypothetical protein